MLTLANGQMNALRVGVLDQFENGLLEHLRTFFPNHVRIVGEAKLRELIRLGLERSRIYGLKSQRDVYLYVSVMLYLGSFFETDVQLSWARQVLADPSLTPPGARAERLFDAAMEYMRRAYGAANEHLTAALERIGLLLQSDTFATAQVRAFSDLQLGLRWVFPTKFDLVGESTLNQLARQCTEAVQTYRIDTQRGATLYLGLMFMLGHEFDKDPQFAWAGQVLEDRLPAAPEERAERLFKEARNQLALWLA